MFPFPFVIYAGFECFTNTIDTAQPNLQSSYTMNYQSRKPSGFCLFVKCFFFKNRNLVMNP